MEYLPYANRVCEGDLDHTPIDAAGKHVVIIGGGDTGADCLGTATRQGAASITQLEIMPRPPQERPAKQPWPTYPMTYRVSSAHEEAGERVYAVSTEEFLADDDGRVRALRLVDVEMVDGRFAPVPGSERRSRPTWSSWPWDSRASRAARGSIAAGRGPRRPRQHRPRLATTPPTWTGSSSPAMLVGGSR